MNSKNDYSDIIDLNRPISHSHSPMPREARAAQFAPFAALTGHEEAINETARLTDKKPSLTDEQGSELDSCLKYIMDNISERLLTEITYFVPDKKKDGGMLLTVTGAVKRVDTVERTIELTDRSKYKLDDIIGIRLVKNKEN